MNNEQLFDLTSPPLAEFDNAQELLQYCNNHAKQLLCSGNQKRKISQSNVILDKSTEKFENIQLQKNKDKHHPGSTIVHLRYMAKNVDGKWRFGVQVPNHNHPASPPEAHPMH